MDKRELIVHVWSENGDIYYMENGDYAPFSLDTNIYDSDANQYLNEEIANLKESGYEIIIGRPKYLTDNWIIDKDLSRHVGD
jgi:hypothetical protein